MKTEWMIAKHTTQHDTLIYTLTFCLCSANEYVLLVI